MWHQDIFEKNDVKNGQKASKNKVFGHFTKIKSLVLSRIVVKRKFLWSFNILQKLNTWEKSGSQVIMAKNRLSVNVISVFFNRQYFFNRLISDFDFWNVDRLQKHFGSGKLAHFESKNHTSS